jgi:hypothetical protein
MLKSTHYDVVDNIEGYTILGILGSSIDYGGEKIFI